MTCNSILSKHGLSLPELLLRCGRHGPCRKARFGHRRPGVLVCSCHGNSPSLLLIPRFLAICWLAQRKNGFWLNLTRSGRTSHGME